MITCMKSKQGTVTLKHSVAKVCLHGIAPSGHKVMTLMKGSFYDNPSVYSGL